LQNVQQRYLLQNIRDRKGTPAAKRSATEGPAIKDPDKGSATGNTSVYDQKVMSNVKFSILLDKKTAKRSQRSLQYTPEINVPRGYKHGKCLGLIFIIISGFV
jgi:hypothetical protein